MSLSGVFLNVLTISASCGAVILVLLLLMPLLRKRVAARSIHVIFLLLALRLVIPFRYTFPEPVVTVREPEISVSLPEAAEYTDERTEKLVIGTMPVEAQRHSHFYEAPLTGPRRSVTLTEIATMVWLAGMGVCLLYWVVSYGRARCSLLKNAYAAEEDELFALKSEAAKMNLSRLPTLQHSAAVQSAVMVGIFKPVIFLPEIPCGEEETLRFILRHELTHYKRRDIAAKLLFSFACAVHWFDPLVWLMSREANRNMELCCDEAVVCGLSPEERRRYGAILLDAAENSRFAAFSTSFGSGKKQLKLRLSGLFTKKKTCAALVCVMAAGIALAGGLVACESIDAADTPPVTQDAPNDMPQDNDTQTKDVHILLEEHFYGHYDPDICSVVLTDLTGDGAEEMIVLRFADRADTSVSLREKTVSREEFGWAGLDVYGVVDGEVTLFFNNSVSSSHVGWSHYYLCTLADGGSALFNFNPYSIQGIASYSYGLFRFNDAGQRVDLERNSVEFALDPFSPMGEVVISDSRETVEEFLARAEEYQDNAVPLLAYYEGFDETDGSSATDFRYWNADPADAFRGDNSGRVEGESCDLKYYLPALPLDAETAMEYLEKSVMETEDGYIFRVPDFAGDWTLEVTGAVSTDGVEYASVHCFEDTEWERGRRYELPLELGLYEDLCIHATVTGEDGVYCEHTIHLEPSHIEACWHGTCQHSQHHNESHHSGDHH